VIYYEYLLDYFFSEKHRWNIAWVLLKTESWIFFKSTEILLYHVLVCIEIHNSLFVKRRLSKNQLYSQMQINYLSSRISKLKFQWSKANNIFHEHWQQLACKFMTRWGEFQVNQVFKWVNTREVFVKQFREILELEIAINISWKNISLITWMESLEIMNAPIKIF
jgi:hypothetical protein